MNNLRSLLLLIAFILIGHGFLHAEDKVDLRNAGLGVPATPAFAILGVSPKSVIRPAVPAELATAALSGIDPEGNYQNGISVESSPWLLFTSAGWVDSSLESYRGDGGGSFLMRRGVNTTLSLASVKGSGENDKSARLALGLRSTFFLNANGDPRLDKSLDKSFESIAAKKPKFPD